MMKVLRCIISFILFLAAPLTATPYKSTQDAIQDIKNTYETIVKSDDNIYKMPRILDSLRTLGTRLNTHIMEKQGVILGRKVESGGLKLRQKIELDNIFNLWGGDEMIY